MLLIWNLKGFGVRMGGGLSQFVFLKMGRVFDTLVILQQARWVCVSGCNAVK